MNYVCSCGNHSTTTLYRLKRGYKCRKCSNPNKYTIEQLQKIFKEKGYTLLSKTYVNKHTKLKFLCSCGNIDYKTLIYFKKISKCRKCMLEDNKKKPYKKRKSLSRRCS